MSSSKPIRYNDVDAPRTPPIVGDYSVVIDDEVPKKRKKNSARRIVVSSTK